MPPPLRRRVFIKCKILLKALLPQLYWIGFRLLSLTRCQCSRWLFVWVHLHSAIICSYRYLYYCQISKCLYLDFMWSKKVVTSYCGIAPRCHTAAEVAGCLLNVWIYGRSGREMVFHQSRNSIWYLYGIKPKHLFCQVNPYVIPTFFALSFLRCLLEPLRVADNKTCCFKPVILLQNWFLLLSQGKAFSDKCNVW